MYDLKMHESVSIPYLALHENKHQTQK